MAEHHRVAAVLGEFAHHAFFLLGIEHAPIRATHDGLAFLDPVAQHCQALVAPAIAQQSPEGLAVFNGVEVVAVIPQALNVLTSEQFGDDAVLEESPPRASRIQSCLTIGVMQEATDRCRYPASRRLSRTDGFPWGATSSVV